LQNKDSVAELFRDVAVKVGNRPGGYTRILKTGTRIGDSAEMCIIELVDYNLTYTQDKKAEQKASATRRRRAPKKKTTEESAAIEPAVESNTESAE
jgi:large subunit ribosomal protein L17